MGSIGLVVSGMYGISMGISTLDRGVRVHLTEAVGGGLVGAMGGTGVMLSWFGSSRPAGRP
jgi:hypothetical protein